MGKATLGSKFISSVQYHYVIIYKVFRLTSGIVASLIVSSILIGCLGYLKHATPSPALPRPSVEPTRLLALVTGIIAVDDGCITLTEDHFGDTYLLAFIPEYSIEIEVDQLRISEPLKADRIIKLDHSVVLGGGILGSDKKRINKEILKNVPEHCDGNIWLGYLTESINDNK